MNPNSTPSLECRGVTRTLQFGPLLLTVLDAVDLRIEAAALTAILGPSGSGKSSLINFLYGMRHEYNGTILYENKNLNQFSIEQMAAHRKDHLSIVFQDLRLFPDQTVKDNIEIKRQLNPYHPADKITEMAVRLGIGSKLSSRCGTCSYGEQQRIAIIRALQQPFNFLLLDEPFSHLDEHNRQIAMELMEEEATARQAAIILADLKVITYFNAQRTLSL